MEKQSLSQKLSHSPTHRNDDILQRKWSQQPSSKPYVDPGISFPDDKDNNRTDQSGAADADINNIVARFHKTGVLPGIDVQSVYADVSDAPTYQEALQTIINAENQFMALDAKTRKRFSNDPSEFLEFVANPENGSELVKLGLATLREPTPSPAAPVSPGGQPGPSKPVSKKDSAPKGDES